MVTKVGEGNFFYNVHLVSSNPKGGATVEQKFCDPTTYANTVGADGRYQ